MWLVFSFISAISVSFKDVASKLGLRKLDEYIIAWSWRFFSLFFLIPAFLIFGSFPQINNNIWLPLAISGLLNLIATILYMKAVKLSDLSLVAPLITFTPLFLLITSPLILGEFPDWLGLLGVLLIVAGAYLLNIKERNNGYWAPFKALLKQKGPKLMLIVAALWGVTSNFDKIGIKNSSPIFWACALNTVIALALIPFAFRQPKINFQKIKTEIKSLLPIGFFDAGEIFFAMTAVSLTLVTYVVSVKRTSTIMSTALGGLIFKEKNIKERLLGALIMVAGVILIALA